MHPRISTATAVQVTVQSLAIVTQQAALHCVDPSWQADNAFVPPTQCWHTM
jgi:hypothetical protein